MDRPLNPHTTKTTAPSLTDATTSVSLSAKIHIIEASIEEKKEAVRELASTMRFSFDRAGQALDLIPLLASTLSTRCRERFVTQVALPLLTREPLALLKICLASSPLQRLNELNDGLPTLLVEHPLKQLSLEIANGTIDRLVDSRILPIRSHAIAYHPSSETRPYRSLIDANMRTMADILDSSPFVREHRYDCLDSTTFFQIERRGSPTQKISGRTPAGHISLVVEPTTSPFDLATALIHEDQQTLFDLAHGLCQPREVVPDSYLQRTLWGKTPLVDTIPAYPSLLLKEFNASTKELLFRIEALHSGLAPQTEVAALRSRIRRELVETRQAETVLEECLERRDFNRHGIALLSKCRDILGSCDSPARGIKALR